MVEKLQAPLGLDGWTITTVLGPRDDASGECFAMPEYKRATLYFDPDQIETGECVDELVTHEMTHCHTWSLNAVAEENAKAIADMLPESARDPIRRKLLEDERKAAEDVTTQVGFTYIRLLRRIWSLETEVAELRAEAKRARREIPKPATTE
jgi:hypothetical protein